MARHVMARVGGLTIQAMDACLTANEAVILEGNFAEDAFCKTPNQTWAG